MISFGSGIGSSISIVIMSGDDIGLGVLASFSAVCGDGWTSWIGRSVCGVVSEGVVEIMFTSAQEYRGSLEEGCRLCPRARNLPVMRDLFSLADLVSITCPLLSITSIGRREGQSVPISISA